MTRTSTVPKRGCGRTSHHRKVGSGIAPARSSRSTDEHQSSSDEKRRGSPVRGKAWKTSVRADAKPVSRPCQKGEFAERASSRGGAHPVHEVDRGFGVAHPDVDVQREGRLTPGEHSHRVVDQLVAAARRHPRVAPQRGRMCAAAGRPQAEGAQRPGEGGADVAELADRRADGVVRVAGQLDRPWWVSAPTRSATAAGSRSRTSSMRWASDQSTGSTSITSSSMPTV